MNVCRSRRIRDSRVFVRIVKESTSVKIDGIHPARRIGKMIFKRSKGPRLCFSNLSRNCIPVVCEKSAHHQLTWLPPQARRMSTAVLLSPFHELRYLTRGWEDSLWET